LVLSLGNAHSQVLPQNQSSTASSLQQWQDAKFGLFIHWGVYSVPAGVHAGKEIAFSSEWIMRRAGISKADYRKYAEQFNPKDYNPSEWVSLAKQTGMKYIVVTAKHHDGFALFDSKVSDWNAVKASGAKRDLLMPLVEECRRQHMPLGFHYSQAQDWWHPGGGKSVPDWDPGQEGVFGDYLEDVSIPQLKELFTDYGPVFSIFFDTPRGMDPGYAKKVKAILPPDLITNDRLYSGALGTFQSYERRFPRKFFPERRWEFCLPSNESWGFKASDTKWKSSHRLKRTLIETVSRGGNFLLNVGPDSSGKFPAPVVESFQKVGSWMQVNGESIYETKRSPYAPIPWKGGCTVRSVPEKNETILYCHLFKRPKGGQLLLPGLSNKLKSVSILGRDGKVPASRLGNSWKFEIPSFQSPEIPVLKIVLEHEIVFEPPSSTPNDKGAFELTASNAILNGKFLSLEQQQDSLTQNIGSWRSSKDSVSWTIHLAQKGDFQTDWLLSCGSDSSGTELRILANEKEISSFKVPDTGGWNQFKSISGPVLSLPAGTFKIKLIPGEKIGREIVNLRSLNFKKL